QHRARRPAMRVFQHPRILFAVAAEQHCSGVGRGRTLQLSAELVEGVDHDITDTVDAEHSLDRALDLRLGDEVGLNLVPGHHVTIGGFPAAIFVADGHKSVRRLRFRGDHFPNLYRRAWPWSIRFPSTAATSAWRC